MLTDPLLSFEQKESTLAVITAQKIGTSVQDLFVERFLVPALYAQQKKGFTNALASGFPTISYASSTYSFEHNYRTISLSDDTSQMIHVGFSYPLVASPLYVGTFHAPLAKRIRSLLQKSFVAYKTTLPDVNPLTFKIAMHATTPSSELYKTTRDKATLRYLDDVITSKNILDVIDMSGAPQDILTMIR